MKTKYDSIKQKYGDLVAPQRMDFHIELITKYYEMQTYNNPNLLTELAQRLHGTKVVAKLFSFGSIYLYL